MNGRPLEPQEGEERISAFLEANPAFEVQAPASVELPSPVAATGAGWVRILPDLLEAEGGLDGFFMARLVRRG